MGHEIWHFEPTGTLSAEAGEFLLTVYAPEQASGVVHFLVARRNRNGASARLIGSGSLDDVREAMAAAEQMAERCAGLSCFEHPAQPDMVSRMPRI